MLVDSLKQLEVQLMPYTQIKALSLGYHPMVLNVQLKCQLLRIQSTQKSQLHYFSLNPLRWDFGKVMIIRLFTSGTKSRKRHFSLESFNSYPSIAIMHQHMHHYC